MAHILESPDDGERDAAEQILRLVISAARPLMWKEIQSRFCIDLDQETADPDEALLSSCKQLCGSLLDVEKGVYSILGSDDAINLVHETARV